MNAYANDHSIKVSYIASLLVCLILSIVLRREHCYTRSILFIIYRPQTSLERRQENTFTHVAYRFSNTNEWNLFFEQRHKRGSRIVLVISRSRRVVHCFYRREIGTSPNCARLFQLPPVARMLKREWERRGRLWGGSFLRVLPI